MASRLLIYQQSASVNFVRRIGKPARIGELVMGAYPSREPEDVKAIRAFAWWERAVPIRVFANARPVRLFNGVLTVHTTTSTWAHELSYLRESLLVAVQKHAPTAAVRELKIRVGPLPAMPVRTPKVPILPIVPLEELPEELARELATLRDDTLRDAIASAAATSLGGTTEPGVNTTGIRDRRGPS